MHYYDIRPGIKITYRGRLAGGTAFGVASQLISSDKLVSAAEFSLYLPWAPGAIGKITDKVIEVRASLSNPGFLPRTNVVALNQISLEMDIDVSGNPQSKRTRVALSADLKIALPMTSDGLLVLVRGEYLHHKSTLTLSGQMIGTLHPFNAHWFWIKDIGIAVELNFKPPPGSSVLGFIELQGSAGLKIGMFEPSVHFQARFGRMDASTLVLTLDPGFTNNQLPNSGGTGDLSNFFVALKGISVREVGGALLTLVTSLIENKAGNHDSRYVSRSRGLMSDIKHGPDVLIDIIMSNVDIITGGTEIDTYKGLNIRMSTSLGDGLKDIVEVFSKDAANVPYYLALNLPMFTSGPLSFSDGLKIYFQVSCILPFKILKMFQHFFFFY